MLSLLRLSLEVVGDLVVDGSGTLPLVEKGPIEVVEIKAVTAGPDGDEDEKTAMS